jgi:hypothetical protein
MSFVVATVLLAGLNPRHAGSRRPTPSTTSQLVISEPGGNRVHELKLIADQGASGQEGAR